jgi:hypothetical protein
MKPINAATNVYWAVYKNLEKEVLELTYTIQFSDNQFEYIKNDGGRPLATEKLMSIFEYIKTPVYSLKSVDLLIRCCTEIEALVKELTRQKDGEVKNTPTVDLNKPLDMGCRLKYLKHIWNLDKKIILVSCPNMYFEKVENKEIAPFNYINGSVDDFYKAYNSVKHDRTPNIYKGNIRFLLRAIAALFLLNLYYKDETYKIGTFKNMKDEITFYEEKNEISYDSDLFSVKTFFVSWGEINYNSDDFLTATYIIAPDARQYAICMDLLNHYGEIFDYNGDNLDSVSPFKSELKNGDIIHRLTMADKNGIAKWVKCEEWVLDKFGQYALRASLNKNQKFDYLRYSNLDSKSWVSELAKIFVTHNN